MEGRNVGTIGGKNSKQGLISAKDLPMLGSPKDGQSKRVLKMENPEES